MMTTIEIPVLLLKTRSQPDDGYEEYFAGFKADDNGNDVDGDAMSSPPSPAFKPRFVPVLEHQPNTANLARIEELLRKGMLTENYGGMIFTSQRAVEAFSDVVRRVDGDLLKSRNQAKQNPLSSSSSSRSPQPPTPATPQQPTPLPVSPSTTTPFPLYVVGPATARSLNSLLLLHHPATTTTDTAATPLPTLTPLHPQILGAQTGNGAALAAFILQHYNDLHANLLFEYHEAPRLPFIPLIGPASGQYARSQRMERDDPRLRKRDLLFLVGEVRRDVIPRTLMDEGALGSERRIGVVELEVYATGVRREFEGEFGALLGGFVEQRRRQQQQLVEGVVVVVVFSPQGCEAMLRALGCLGADGRAREEVRRDRWRREDGVTEWRGGDGPPGCSTRGGATMRYVVATIGPTTRDHLIDTFGFEPDVCASKPSPEGVGEGVRAFLRSKGIIK